MSFTVPHRPAIILLAFYDRLSASDCFHSKRILQPPCFCTLTPHIQSPLVHSQRPTASFQDTEAGKASLSVSQNIQIQQRQLDKILSTSIRCDYNLLCEVWKIENMLNFNCFQNRVCKVYPVQSHQIHKLFLTFNTLSMEAAR